MTGVERIALRRRRAVAARVAAVVRGLFPAADVAAGAEGVVVTGRGLSRRMLVDVDARDIAGAVRREGGA